MGYAVQSPRVQSPREITRLRAALARQEAALAEKDNAIAEMELALAEKDTALAQKIDELKRLQQHMKLSTEQAKDVDICITINSATDLTEMHEELTQRIQEAAERPGNLNFMIKLMRVTETSTMCTEAGSERTADATESAAQEENDNLMRSLQRKLSGEELSKVQNLMQRFGEDPEICIEALKHRQWHAGRAGQYLKKRKSGIEESPKGIAAMSQCDLVMSSIESDDLQFASSIPSARTELLAFKTHLKAADSPVDVLDISKFIAQGTAGWVFEAKWKSNGKRQALKIIRMTQVSTGMREWYISKLLRNAGINNIVFTNEDVYVLNKKIAPEVVRKQLEFAGPVPFYACFIQEFMGGGSLEDLAQKGLLTPVLLFKALAIVSNTLMEMHKHSVQHRDVKPENIMLDIREGELIAAKLCDLGSAELGDNPKGEADDVRRFGVTVFALATCEPWTKNQLIRAKHEDLINRIEVAATGFEDGPMKCLPGVVHELLEDSPSMNRAAQLMADLSGSFWEV